MNAIDSSNKVGGMGGGGGGGRIPGNSACQSVFIIGVYKSKV